MFKKAQPSTPDYTPQPGKSDTKGEPGKTAEKPAKPGEETPNNPAQPAKQQELPNTGTGNEVSIFGAAASAILASLGLSVPGKKRDEE